MLSIFKLADQNCLLFCVDEEQQDEPEEEGSDKEMETELNT